MKSFRARSVAVAFGLALAAGQAYGQQGFGEPSLLPLPPVEYPVYQTAARTNLWSEGETSPAEALPSPSDRQPSNSVLTPNSQQYTPPQGGAEYSLSSPSSCTSGAGGGDVQYDNGIAGSCGFGAAPVCNNSWYAGAAGLFMTRDKRHGFNTSIDDYDSNVVLSNCGCNASDLIGGFELTLGRTFNCNQNAIQVNYWGLFPGTTWNDAVGADMTGNLNTTFNFNDLDYDDGNGSNGPVQDWYNNSQHHQLDTSYSINSVEVNLLGQTCGGNIFGCGNSLYAGCGCGPRMSFGWSAGLRYFQFNEGMAFGTDDVDTVWGNGSNEIWYENEVNNNLLGFQLGGLLNYRLTNCWSVFANGKAGVYGNHATNNQSVYGSNGLATMNNGGWAGEEYDIHSSTTDLAMLAQFDLGVQWQISCRWSVNVGYRVVGVSGVALMADQLPTDYSNMDVISDINTNGSLLLHGGFAGATFCF